MSANKDVDFDSLVKAHGYIKARQILKRSTVQQHQHLIQQKEVEVHKSHEAQRIRESTLLSSTSGNLAYNPMLEKILQGNSSIAALDSSSSFSGIPTNVLSLIRQTGQKKSSKDNFLSSQEFQYTLLPQSKSNLLISNQNITHIPHEFCDTLYLQLGYLNQINLTRNNLSNIINSELPSLSIYHFRYVKKLNLSFNKLRRLPDNIGVLQCLEEFNLSNNNLSTLPKSFSQLKRLVKLNLTNNNFAQLFEELSYLNNILELDLSHNLFINFPSSVLKLQSLKKLVFSYNALSHLAVFQPSLTNMDMWKPIVDSYNGKTVYVNILTREKVSHIACYDGKGLQYQHDLGQFQSSHYSNRKYYFRRKLWLNMCHIPEFESDMDIATGQTYFRNNVSGEAVWEMPAVLDSFGTLNTLVELHIVSNALKELPKSVLQLKNIVRLVLIKNRLRCLPEEIHRLDLLELIDISSNEVESLPNNIIYCKRLKELLVTDNRLSVLPKTLGDELQGCLVRLDVSVNRLNQIPSSLGLCQQLKYFYFHENPLTDYEKLREEFQKGMKSFLWYLKNFYLIEKYKKKPPVIEYSHISINEEVNIVKNELIAIIQQRLDILKEKSLLNLQLLGIEEIPKIMYQRKYCKVITKLRFDFNPKLVLSEEFVEKLCSLEMLSCRGCRLSSIPENIYRWESMMTLNLEENNLEFIPDGIAELINLNYLSKSSIYSLN